MDQLRALRGGRGVWATLAISGMTLFVLLILMRSALGAFWPVILSTGAVCLLSGSFAWLIVRQAWGEWQATQSRHHGRVSDRSPGGHILNEAYLPSGHWREGTGGMPVPMPQKIDTPSYPDLPPLKPSMPGRLQRGVWNPIGGVAAASAEVNAMISDANAASQSVVSSVSAIDEALRNLLSVIERQPGGGRRGRRQNAESDVSVIRNPAIERMAEEMKAAASHIRQVSADASLVADVASQHLRVAFMMLETARIDREGSAVAGEVKPASRTQAA